jgi:hypothetical protein
MKEVAAHIISGFMKHLIDSVLFRSILMQHGNIAIATIINVSRGGMDGRNECSNSCTNPPVFEFLTGIFKTVVKDLSAKL